MIGGPRRAYGVPSEKENTMSRSASETSYLPVFVVSFTEPLVSSALT